MRVVALLVLAACGNKAASHVDASGGSDGSGGDGALGTCGDHSGAPLHCETTPSGCGYPDATNTGVPAGTALVTHNGDLTITQDGTVIDGMDIHGCVRVQAANVTIRNSKISCPSFVSVAGFQGEHTGTLLIEDSEVDCALTNGTAIGDDSITAHRLNIHDCENGFDLNTNIDIEDSYIHDLYEGGVDPHTDGIQMAVGQHIVIRHNTIFVAAGTSAIISNPTDTNDVVIDNNFLGGGAYTLYCPRTASVGFVVTNNRFTPQGSFGPTDSCDTIALYCNNYFDADGTAVPPT